MLTPHSKDAYLAQLRDDEHFIGRWACACATAYPLDF